MVTILELTDLQELIIKNSIYNRILISTLLNETSFCVASTLQPLKKETEEILKGQANRKQLPNYLLYDIWVRVNENSFSIGLKYHDDEIIWEHPDKEIKRLKELVKFIYETYHIHPARADKLFSKLPKDVKYFLENNNFPSNLWQLGFSKKIKLPHHDELNLKKVSEYREDLCRKNTTYRVLNKILVYVLKNKLFSAENNLGSISVVPTMFKNKLLISFESKTEWKAYHDIFPIQAFTPDDWNLVDSNISISNLLSIVDI